MALGARTRQLVLSVVGRSMAIVAVGSIIGVMGAAALAQTLELSLYEISPLDPTTYAAVVLLLAIVALFASLAPAFRVSRMSAIDAFRHN